MGISGWAPVWPHRRSWSWRRIEWQSPQSLVVPGIILPILISVASYLIIPFLLGVISIVVSGTDVVGGVEGPTDEVEGPVVALLIGGRDGYGARGIHSWMLLHGRQLGGHRSQAQAKTSAHILASGQQVAASPKDKHGQVVGGSDSRWFDGIRRVSK
ncbi:hypothetical protein GUJ93_ZPchr0004g39614 [Zizania palustris]|uniref:Uncharacterized protein n=1 Tax=Zizania palustris TaxID=103762 RepID=A0A8J5S087_ZIZPA|nr:hypothetical protein GUJ93_ZPchr0004g39614 [Zizania palustris]